MPQQPQPAKQPDSTVRLLQLRPDNPLHLARLCGAANSHLRLIAQRLDIGIHQRGNKLQLSGGSTPVQQAEKVLLALYKQVETGDLDQSKIHLALLAPENKASEPQGTASEPGQAAAPVVLQTPRMHIKAMSRAQAQYIRALRESDLCFGVGPAGVGKTWLAVAAAVEALTAGEIEQIVLVRPAVEAGERLGFLPGDLSQKVEPYQKPLYDAICDFVGAENAAQMMQRGAVEMLPLAYMRGRTLNNAFIVLDESQNATIEQMKMLLTRIGIGSKVAVTGDLSQSDLPRGTVSGLSHALELLEKLPGVQAVRLDRSSVVRHPIVRRILSAYEKDDHRRQQQDRASP